MQRRPRRAVCRTKLGKRLMVRIPPESHSLRMVVNAVCHNQSVCTTTLRKLEPRIRPCNTDKQTWHAIVQTVPKRRVLDCLVSLCSNAQTGPVTSWVIQRLVGELQEVQLAQQKARSPCALAERAACEQQRWRQAYLEALCESVDL
jgi:hypothetical protein